MRTRLVLALCVAGALTGCGGGGDKVNSASAPTPSASATPTDASPVPLPEVSPDPALAKDVPTAIEKDGKIVIGTDSTYAPNEFLDADGHTVRGFEIDLFNAVAAKLGLTTSYVSAPFANVIPGVLSGKYDLAVSSLTINADRLKVGDLVSYYSSGTEWATQAGNPANVSLDDACGKRIAVQTGTVEVDDLAARSKTCTTAGKAAINVDQYQAQDQATAAAVSGKDDAMIADSPVTDYAITHTAGKLTVLGDVYGAAPYGFLLKKGQTAFADAIAAAVNDLIADGSYRQILTSWGVEGGAITSSKVDPTP
jgi:polar amino acid transport system substrate-binding protein